ncbi:MAG: M48 family metallopeptidase [Verrucomicrobia bacterium]|nr:M48 family metallopeptidase [Verrucomicrobiota bacterium]
MNGWRDKTDFKTRVLEWAAKLGVKTQSLAVRPMRNKWASCSTAGHLNFNAQLLELEREVGEYVIVHELLHFSVPNHGKLWKSLMRAHLGDYERLDERLQRSAEAGENFHVAGGNMDPALKKRRGAGRPSHGSTRHASNSSFSPDSMDASA